MSGGRRTAGTFGGKCLASRTLHLQQFPTRNEGPSEGQMKGRISRLDMPGAWSGRTRKKSRQTMDERERQYWRRKEGYMPPYPQQ